MEEEPKLKDVSYATIETKKLLRKIFDPQDPNVGRVADYLGAEGEEEMGLFNGYCPYCHAGFFETSQEVEDHLDDGDCDQYRNWLDLQERSSRDD